MLGSVYGLSGTWIYVIYIGYWSVFRCDYSSWVVIWMEISMTLRIWVEYIHCLDCSILDSRSLLSLDILSYLWNLTGYSLYIYLTTIMFMLLDLLGKYYYTVTTPACLLVTYILVIPVSCYLTCYTPVIPVPWLSHVDIVTVTTTESSQRFK